ncbi:MAG: CoA transferase [Deltaproteobacteria bacterium]|nr:CoA transferase [Deltaproteobacteria bacterium]
MQKKALEGLRILDLGAVWAIPHAGTLMANMGAEVIKVESIQFLDMVRGLISPFPVLAESYPDRTAGEHPWNRNNYFNDTNLGKLSITLNLTDKKGLEIFKRLLKISDVVMENFRLGTMERFGLTYEVMKEVNPGIIYVSAPGYGAGGPESEYVAFGANQWHATGLANITGYPDEEPVQASINYGDPIAGVHVFGLVMAALLYRKRSGKGQFIDVSQTEPGVRCIGEFILDYTMNDRLPGRIGNRHPWLAPQGCYRCRPTETYIKVLITSEEEWKAFCRAIDMPDLARDDRFSTAEKKWENRQELDRIIEDEYTSYYSPHEALAPIKREGITAGPAAGPDDFSKPPQYKFLAPLGPYRCMDLDQWITLTVTSEEEWRALCGVMGQPELAGDERFSSNEARYRNQDTLNELIENWTISQNHYEVFHLLQRAGIAAGPALAMNEVLSEPQHRFRGLYQPVTHPETFTYLEPNHAWLMSETPRKLKGPSPCLGEHNDLVYGGILGMSREEIEELEREQIIGVIPLPGADGMGERTTGK